MNREISLDGQTYVFRPVTHGVHFNVKAPGQFGLTIALAHAERIAKALSSDQEFDIESAMCVWEYILDNAANHPWQGYLEGHGYGAIRMCAIEAGQIAHEVWTLLDSQGWELIGSFDWEFVPVICDLIDWPKLIEGNQYGGPKYEPDIAHLAGQVLQRLQDIYTFEDPKKGWMRQARYQASHRWGYEELVDEHMDVAERAYARGDTPAEFVKWFGEKYDLIPRH